MPGDVSAPAGMELEAPAPGGGKLSVSIEFSNNGATVEVRWPLDNKRIESTLPAEWDVEQRPRYMLATGKLAASNPLACVAEVRKVFDDVVELSPATYWFITNDGAIGIQYVTSGTSHQLVIERSEPGPLPAPEEAERGTGTLNLMTSINEEEFTGGIAFNDGKLTLTLAEPPGDDLLSLMSEIVRLYNMNHHPTNTP